MLPCRLHTTTTTGHKRGLSGEIWKCAEHVDDILATLLQQHTIQYLRVVCRLGAAEAVASHCVTL